MNIQEGNLDLFHQQNSDARGWFVGSFVPDDSLLHSDVCEVKWVRHPKGLKKTAGKALVSGDRTVIILMSGKWLTRFPSEQKEYVLRRPGDFLVYTGGPHENEALEDTHLMVIRWSA